MKDCPRKRGRPRTDMKRRIAASLTSIVCVVFTYVEYRLMTGVTQQHLPGYPSAEQWRFHVYFPLIIVVVSIGSLLLARRMPVRLFAGTSILQLALLLVPL